MSKTYFTQDHEWLSVEGQVVTVGVTHYAQEQLGDLVLLIYHKVGQNFPKERQLLLWNR